MKIVFLNIYNGLVNRGSERSTHELASYLGKKHEVYLIAGKESRSKVNYQTYVIYPVFPKYPDTSFCFLRKFYLDCWSLQILLFTLKAIPFLWKKHFDIVIPVNGGWQTVICRLLTWLQKSKLVIIGRAGIGRDDAWNLLWRPDIFVALTVSAFKWAKERARGLPIVHIPNAVNLSQFYPEGSSAQIPLKPPIILCVGAFTPNKQIEKTISTMVELKDVSLLILGEGPQYRYLKDLGKKLLGEERFLITSVTHDEMPKYYRAAKLFTLVSKTGEAFGNVYLEAMACNLPVVATNDETRKEIIGDTGLLVNPENIDEYVIALKKTIQKDFGDLPRRQAEKFSWEEVGRRYEELFETLR